MEYLQYIVPFIQDDHNISDIRFWQLFRKSLLKPISIRTFLLLVIAIKYLKKVIQPAYYIINFLSIENGTTGLIIKHAELFCKI